MKAKPFTITRIAAALIVLILLLIPFHAFLTVWFNSIFGHYTALRLWKEVLLIALTGLAIDLLWSEKAVRQFFIASTLNKLIITYLAVLIFWGALCYIVGHVTLKALGYGWIVDGRFLLFFLLVSIFASHNPRLRTAWSKLVIWPAAIVVLFGLLQYALLPYDFMRHFGYNESTIFPYETINHNIHYIRIMSTLRGANPLGAYLIVVISLLAALCLKLRTRGTVLAGILATFALGLTFSRSAWIGLVLSAGVLLWASLRTTRSRRIAIGSVIGIVVVAAVVGLSLHGNTAFQNTIFHTDDKSKIATSSNEGHASALKNGLHDVVREPLGEGVGTAGPASVYNLKQVSLRQPTGAVLTVERSQIRIAENYFVQIAQEVGWLGIALFIAIQAYVARELWRKRADPLSLGLLAAFVGLTFVNLLSHAWADDTLAYIFWGLAGIALAQPVAVARPKAKAKAKPPVKLVT